MAAAGSLPVFILIIARALLAAGLSYFHSIRCKACSRWCALKKVEKKLLYATQTGKRTRHVFECRFCHRRQGYERNA